MVLYYRFILSRGTSVQTVCDCCYLFRFQTCVDTVFIGLPYLLSYFCSVAIPLFKWYIQACPSCCRTSVQMVCAGLPFLFVVPLFKWYVQDYLFCCRTSVQVVCIGLPFLLPYLCSCGIYRITFSVAVPLLFKWYTQALPVLLLYLFKQYVQAYPFCCHTSVQMVHRLTLSNAAPLFKGEVKAYPFCCSTSVVQINGIHRLTLSVAVPLFVQVVCIDLPFLLLNLCSFKWYVQTYRFCCHTSVRSSDMYRLTVSVVIPLFVQVICIDLPFLLSYLCSFKWYVQTYRFCCHTSVRSSGMYRLTLSVAVPLFKRYAQT